MADALGLRVEQLIKHYVTLNLSCREKAPDCKRMVTESLDGLMNYLRDMMVGYANEEVMALLKQMEGLVDSEACDRHEDDVTSYMEPGRLDLMTKTWVDDVRDIQIRRLDKMILICEQLCNIRYNVEEEAVVMGFDDEVEILLDQLTGPSMKQLQIISITGMVGIGKTTLARTLYNHELIKYMFDFRAWVSVSQVYLKKDLLLGILSSFIGVVTEEYYEMSDHQLGEKLYRLLKGRKYLVVFDDIWDSGVWNDLKMYFPDDKTGSRVLFTSRDLDVSLHVQSARPAHVLRFRTGAESWCIFQRKVFRMGICPGRFVKSGRVINRKCEGLPLAIVIAAGLLKNNLSTTWWEKVSASLHSFIVSDPAQYVDSLALSYNHMPPHLKPCFLYFGSFPEDYEVPVSKLA